MTAPQATTIVGVSRRMGAAVRTFALTTILVTPLLTVGCGDATRGSSPPAPPTNTSAAPDHAQQIENWRHDHRSAFTALGTALSDLGGAMTAGDWNAIHADCPKASEASNAMSSALPTPDEKLTAALRAMVDNLNAAMTECPQLNATSDQIDASSFTKHLAVVGKQFAVVEGILK